MVALLAQSWIADWRQLDINLCEQGIHINGVLFPTRSWWEAFRDEQEWRQNSPPRLLPWVTISSTALGDGRILSGSRRVQEVNDSPGMPRTPKGLQVTEKRRAAPGQHLPVFIQADGRRDSCRPTP